MPLARIEIEQTGHDRWVAEVEAGGITARAARVQAATFEGILAAVARTYLELDRIVRGSEAGPPAIVPASVPTPAPEPASAAATGLQTRPRWTLSLRRRRA
jgi:hypothetical protein